MIDRGEERIWRQDSCVNTRGMLSASNVKSVFARHVRNAIEYLGYGRYVETQICNREEVTKDSVKGSKVQAHKYWV